MNEKSGQDPSLIERIHDGEDLTGADLSNLDLSEQELVHARLPQSKCRKTNFMKATLRYADFSGADLRGAFFIGANLLEANFENADLRRADLYLSDLTRARLKGANLEHANLQSACLQGADLTRANLRAANLNKANLLDAITFETTFRGASMIETRTLREKALKKSWFNAWVLSRSPYFSNFYMVIITGGFGALFGTVATSVANAPYWAIPVSGLIGVAVGFGIGQLLEFFTTKVPEILYGRTRNVGYTEILYKGDLGNADFLYRNQHWSEAIKAYREILGKDPDKLEPQFRIARIYHQGLRDPGKARAAYQQIIDRYGQALGEEHMYILESRRGLKELMKAGDDSAMMGL